MTRLCRAHRLHSALAFLFTRALADYAAPAAELLLAHAHAPADPPHTLHPTPGGSSLAGLGANGGAADAGGRGNAGAWGPKRAAGYKLLVYLRCCFAGRAVPPGMGSGFGVGTLSSQHACASLSQVNN